MNKYNENKTKTLQKASLLTLCLLSSLLVTACGSANNAYEKEAYSNFTVDKEKYQLDKVIVISRHNIRSPLTDGEPGSGCLSELTNHEWFKWTSAPSELSLKGAQLETQFAQYFHSYLVDNNFIIENPTTKDVENSFYFRSNSMQRTIATAKYFSSALLPNANVSVHSESIDATNEDKDEIKNYHMEDLFLPGYTFYSDSYVNKFNEEINEYIKPLAKSLDDNYKLLESVLDYKNSIESKTKLTTFSVDDVVAVFPSKENIEGKDNGKKENTFKSHTSLKVGNTAVDALKLQYYEEEDENKASFGKKLTYEDWVKIGEIGDVYSKALFTLPSFAPHLAHPLLNEINNQLLGIDDQDIKRSEHKFAFYCGHDSNIASVLAALGAKGYVAGKEEYNKYLLPQSIEKLTPIGSKIMIERWKDNSNENYYSISLTYQNLNQLRNGKSLTLDNPPIKFELELEGLTKNNDKLYKESDFLNLVQNKVDLDAKIKETYKD